MMDRRVWDRLAHSLKNTILDLINVLKDDILTEPEEVSDLTIVEFFFSRLHPITVMKHVTDHILPYSKMITKRDSNFFLENSSIFKGLPDNRVKYYMTIIANSPRLDKDDRDEIWQYFDTFITFAEEYKKNT